MTTHTEMQLGYADVMKGCSDITDATTGKNEMMNILASSVVV